MKLKPLPCPFCTHDEIEICRFDDPAGMDDQVWRVCCGGAGCGVLGPPNDFREGAVRGWNTATRR